MRRSQTKTIAHWPDEDPWEPGVVIFGKRNHWRVVAHEPIESRRFANQWRYTVEPLGVHGRDWDDICRTERATVVSMGKHPEPALLL